MDTAKPELVKAYLLDLQSRIIDALQEVDSQASSRRDEWVVQKAAEVSPNY